MELKEHSPSQYNTIYIDCNYIKDAPYSKIVDDFFNQIKEFKFDIEKFDREVALNTDSLPNSYTLSKIDAEGNTTSKTFSRVECSSTATLLKNEIMNAISEMGESISESEKRQVLLEALESLC